MEAGVTEEENQVSTFSWTRTLSGDLFGLGPHYIAAQAAAVSSQFPSIWFVNFSPSLSQAQKSKLQQYQQEVLDYRCWSSLNWWQEVFNRIPPSLGENDRILQSREVARVAYLDMKRTPWYVF